MTDDELNQESKHATTLLRGKTVRFVLRHREQEIAIEFTDGIRLFIHHSPTGVEVSIT
jgi:hypothetical protein